LAEGGEENLLRSVKVLKKGTRKAGTRRKTGRGLNSEKGRFRKGQVVNVDQDSKKKETRKVVLRKTRGGERGGE